MKHVLVTGATRGIGRAIAQLMLDQEWKVTGTARQNEFPAELIQHPSFHGLKLDFACLPALAPSLKPLILDHRPDVLINNVGMFLAADFSMDDESWLAVMQQTLDVNLTSAALLCKWFVNAHVDAGTPGVIINIASRAAYRGDLPEYAAYAASKGALVAFTKSLARGYGRKGIVAYSIAPGFTHTDMAEESIKTIGEANLTRDSAFDQLTQPEEIAQLAAFLARGQVKHMTGSTIHINGGSYLI